MLIKIEKDTGKHNDLIYSNLSKPYKSEFHQIPIPVGKRFTSGTIVDYDTKKRYSYRFIGRAKILSCRFNVSAPNCDIIDVDTKREHHMIRLEYLERVEKGE